VAADHNDHKVGACRAFSDRAWPASGRARGGLETTLTATSAVVPSPARPESPATVDLHGEATPPSRLARQLWAARPLLVILARKEFHVRYRRASFGLLWAVGLPLLQSAIVAVVFSRVARFGHAPHYPVFVLSGMAPWLYVTAVLGTGATAIVDSADLSSRVYFPRVVLPLVQVVAGLYGFAVTVAAMVALCPVFGVGLGPRTLLLLPASALLVVLAAAACVVASILHVYFRDVRYLVTAGLMVWMYVTPVIYPAADLGRLRVAVDLNPLTGVVDLFHAATVGGAGPMAVAVWVSVCWAVVLLVSGAALACRFDRVAADLL